MGSGGAMADVLGLTGWVTETHALAEAREEEIFAKLQAMKAQGGCMLASTYGKPPSDGPDSHAAHRMPGIHDWHVYSVLDVSKEGDTRYVLLRNPWGSSEPGFDGADDGTFRLPLSDFLKAYETLAVASPETGKEFMPPPKG